MIGESGQETLHWTLAFQMFSLTGLRTSHTVDSKSDRMDISAQRLQIVGSCRRHTHDPMLNPFSRECARRPPPPPDPSTHLRLAPRMKTGWKYLSIANPRNPC